MTRSVWVAGSACVLALIMILGVRGASAAGCCDGQDSKTAVKAEGQTVAQKTCPVMGNPINPKIFVDYNGRRIYFCCAMCPTTFNKDPEKYVKIVDEQLRAANGDKAQAPATEPHEGHAH